MRVLWFTGVQLPALTGQGLTRAGWQEGLRQALETHQPQVELGIAAFGLEPRQPVSQGNATYFTLPNPSTRGRWTRLRKAWRHLTYTAEDIKVCIELVNRFKPDLVHFHGTENFFGLIADRIPMPSVLSLQAIIHGLQPFFFTDAGPRDILRMLATLKFVKGEGPIHRWLTLGKYLPVEQMILQACQNYIGRTEWDHAVLSALNPQANYFHCDEVMANAYYSQEWRGASASGETIYTTTTDSFFKGSAILVEAVAVLKRRGRTDIRLRLAGTHSRSNIGLSLGKLVKKEHLEENVVWLGRVSPEQISAEMLRAKVYVHPSHMDNSPNSLCEALLVGMPCIAAYAGGVPSLVTDGVDGLLYHDRDAFILADKIAHLLSDQSKAARLGARARQRAMQRHDRHSIAERTVQIYGQVVQSGRPTDSPS